MLWGLAALVSLGIFWGLYRGDRNVAASLTDQTAYVRWEAENKPYAQASVYLPEDNTVSSAALSSLRLAVENALTAAGVPSQEYPWFYAASRSTQAALQNDNGNLTTTVELNLVAGDYFRMHPMVLRTGWYMSESDVMHDRIVLDRQTAWNLFYTDDIIGQFLWWNGQRYQVAAVVDYPEGRYNEKAAGDTCRAWVFWDSPGAQSSSLTSAADTAASTAGSTGGSTAGTTGDTTGKDSAPVPASSDIGFTCLEMVLPQPVKNFALSTLQSVLKDSLPENTVYTDNAGRFSLQSRWSILRSYSLRGISTEAVGYPWYENAAQLAENHLALRLIPEAIFLIFPAISLLIWLILLNRKRTWGLYSIPQAVSRAIDRRNARNYEARLRGEEPQPRFRHGKRSKRPKKPPELRYSRKPRRFRRK